MNRDSNSILLWTGFDPVPDLGGGNLRTAQIVELSAEAGFAVRRIGTDARVPFLARLSGGLRSRFALRRAGILIPLRNLFLHGFYDAILRLAFIGHRGVRLLLWEQTSIALPALLAKEFGFTVIALPQNMESLVGSRESMALMPPEFAALSMADRVVCISDEESWLLANLGMPSGILRYHPVKSRRLALEAIARRREGGLAADAPWVVLGSAHNICNREGMRTLLRWIQQGLREGMKFTLAGFGTEKLEGEFAATGIRFLGTVPGRQLEELMAAARGVLVHQDYGAGALTRIPEALIARVPVIANRIAARSTRGCDGISIYDSQEELLNLLRAGAAAVDRPPPPPAEEMHRFVALLQSASKRNG